MSSVSPYPDPDKPENKRSHAKAQRRKENLQAIRNPKNAYLSRL